MNNRSKYIAECEERLISASSARNWWSTLKESVLGVGSTISPLQTVDGFLVSDPAGKAALLSKFLTGNGLGMLLTVLLPLIAEPSFMLMSLGPGCSYVFFLCFF